MPGLWFQPHWFSPFSADADSDSAVRTRLHAALVARIGMLTMTGSPNATIASDIELNANTLTYPCIAVNYADQGEDEQSVLCGQDDIAYKFLVYIFDRRPLGVSPLKARYELWKQQVMQAIRNQRFSSVSESVINKVRPLPNVYFSGGSSYMIYAQQMEVLCIAREPRG